MLDKANSFLSNLFVDESISINSFSRATSINFDTSISLLTKLSNRNIIGKKIIICCTNDDNDLKHCFDFDDSLKLDAFLKENEMNCPNCFFNLDTKNIKVYFYIKNSNLGDANG